MKQLLTILFFFTTVSLFSQSEGGFGFRRYSNTTNLNNTSVNNSDKSASRSAYVHSNGLYYVWDGNSWEREHDIDTLSVSNDTLRISLYGDGVPAKKVFLNVSSVNIFNSDGNQDDTMRVYGMYSDQTLFMGKWPSKPSINYDGTEFGLAVIPTQAVVLANGDSTDNSYSILYLEKDKLNFEGYHPATGGSGGLGAGYDGISGSSSYDGTSANAGTFNVYGTPTTGGANLLVKSDIGTQGLSGFTLDKRSTMDIWGIFQEERDTNWSTSVSLGTSSLNNNMHSIFSRRMYSVSVRSAVSGVSYDYYGTFLPNDTTSNAFYLYNRSYYFPNATPSNTVGDTSLIVWVGNGTNAGKNPIFVDVDDIKGSVNTIYTGNGTVTDRDVEINGFMNWNDADGDGEFNVSIGSLSGANLFLTNIESKINYFDVAGTSSFVADGSGVEIATTSGTDNINLVSAGTVDIQADSVLLSNIPTTTALKSITGFNTTNTLKKIVGSSNGQVLTWNQSSGQWEAQAGATNIYNSNGTTTANTRVATILETLRFVGTADFGEPYPFQVTSTGNEPRIQLWKGNADSVWLYQSDVEYHYGSSAHLVLESNDKIWVTADSIYLTTLESKTKVRGIIGITGGNYLKQFDGDAATIGDAIVSNGTDWIVSSVMERTTVTSGAGTLNLGTSTCYVFTGTTTTWTLPTIAGNTNKVYFIKNRGSGAITLNTNAGGNDIYTTSAVNTITINAGESELLWNDGTYFVEMY